MPYTEGTRFSMWMTPSSSNRREASLARFFLPVSETPGMNVCTLCMNASAAEPNEHRRLEVGGGGASSTLKNKNS